MISLVALVLFVFKAFCWFCKVLNSELKSLKASRTPSKIDDIRRFLSGLDDDFVALTGAGFLDDILDDLLMA